MKDGFILKSVKMIARSQFLLDLKFTRLIRNFQGKQIFNLDGSCNHCGECCQTPMIQIFPPFFYVKTIRRIILIWHRVINGFEFIGEDRKGKCFIFKCTHWQSKSGRCDSYNSRPGICKDYPRNLLDSFNPKFLDGCGFYAVLKNSNKMEMAVDKLDLPENKKQELKRKLNIQ